MATSAKRNDGPEGYPLLELLADRALNGGDEEALGALASLIISDDKNQSFVIKSIRGYDGAHTATAHDALQSALITFMDRARKGEYRGISSDVRVVVVRLAKHVIHRDNQDRRKDPLFGSKETLGGMKHKVKDRAQKPPDALMRASEKGTLESAIETLGTRVQNVIALRKEGQRYTQIGRALGIDPRSAQKHVERCVADIISAIAKRNPTKAQELARKLHPNSPKFPAPNPEDVRTFVYDRLPEESREVIAGIHYEAKKLEHFIGELGSRVAKARLKVGYVLLASQFRVPFPAAFEAMNS